MKKIIFGVFLFYTLNPPAFSQWDPFNGLWGKSHERDLRVMTWNVADGLCSTNFKTEAFNNWTALAVIVAALKPDLLLIQEAGDNSGNGTGFEQDSLSDLAMTLFLFFHGGSDPFHGNAPITAYVHKYAAGYDLPHIFVSELTDGYNRNVILSRFPFADLNGDGIEILSDLPRVSSHAYAPGGTGGVRGFQFAEIDLPDLCFQGDLVVGNAHLKAGSDPENHAARIAAAQNTAFFVDHLYNGAGIGIPDPYNLIVDMPAARSILSASTPVILGGDWNEDEWVNNRDGPAVWLARARWETGQRDDGTDRDRSDSSFEKDAHPITGWTGSHVSGRKYDYIVRQDSIAVCRRSFLFDVSYISEDQMPAEVLHFPVPTFASSVASDHSPVIVDLKLPCPLFRSPQHQATGRSNNSNRKILPVEISEP